MKTLVKPRNELQAAGRWDIDFHLPAEGIRAFPKTLMKRIDQVAEIAKDKRDPGREPDQGFKYIDIAAVDVTVGTITNPQDMDGSEAPSRARKVVRAFDLIVSTCRPTRGAISVVPERLHNQIASTAFSIVRAKSGVNPFYLHYALRLPSTLEQFRKWSTGSSYPAILDSDVRKTLIPVPPPAVQDEVAAKVMTALRERAQAIKCANTSWTHTLTEITASFAGHAVEEMPEIEELDDFRLCSLKEIERSIRNLPALIVDRGVVAEETSDMLDLQEAAE